ncbi:DUF421 domain-containing protein [Clostridium polynesiense]|uniref:DUF421 domain-containing protein n=1 Tax=Clostridium polynesiense TaxID=1325933 RepID=UPI00058E1410|nr:YetF domain-containing protein [Clostridium polynesiense]
MEYVVSYTIRIVLVYLFTYICARILTKKAIAQMSAYEFAGLMILANVAAEPLVDKIVIKSIYGTGVLVLLMFISAKLSLINKLTPIMEHTPLVIVNKGKIQMDNLKYLGLSLNQFMGLLRQQGYSDVNVLDMVIMEPQGNLSVFPTGDRQPVTLKDINIKSQDSGFTIPLIMDGKIIHINLQHIHKDKSWLFEELEKQGIDDFKNQVVLAAIDSSGKLIISKNKA